MIAATENAPIPLFLDEEKQAADKLIAGLADEVSNVYILRLHDIDTARDALEPILAGYLLTNAVLMSRTPRKIRKFISFGTADPGLLYAYTNLLRGMLHGGFTSLGEVHNWKKLVQERWPIAENLTSAVDGAVRFFETSGISSGAAGYHRADILLGVEGVPASETEGGQFYLDDTDLFSPILSGMHASTKVRIADEFRRTGLQLSTGLKGRNVIIDIDCTRLDAAMANWLGNLHHVLELDFYIVGGR